MSTQLEDVELELKRTRLLREQLALADDLKRRERPARAVLEVKAAARNVKVAAQATVPAVKGAARAAAFVATWAVLVAIADFMIAENDALGLRLPAEALAGYYFFWALIFGTLWALFAWPWASLPARERSPQRTLWRLGGGWLLVVVAAPYIIRWLSFQT